MWRAPVQRSAVSAGAPGTGSDAIERIGVVVEHYAAAEPPVAVLLAQLAFVATGRQGAMPASLADQHEQVSRGRCKIARRADLGGDVADEVAELPAARALRRKSRGKRADRLGPADDPDDRALQRGVAGEASDHGLDLAVVERRR